MRFDVQLDDGRPHRVLVVHPGTTALLVVVDEAAPLLQALPAAGVDDCGTNQDVGCFLTLGGRLSSTGVALVMTGALSFVRVYPDTALTAHPQPAPTTPAPTTTMAPTTAGTTAATPMVDMLAPGNNDGSITGGSTGFVFDGLTGLKVTEHPAVGTRFSVFLRVAVTAGTSGYLWAKSDLSGDVRYFSLYARASQASVYLFYTPQGSSSTAFAKFPFQLSDGNLYRVLLSVDGNQATLRVSGLTANFANTQPLAGLVQDCGVPAANCVLYLGQKSTLGGGSLQLSGRMTSAKLYYQHALTSFPEPLVDPSATTPAASQVTELLAAAVPAGAADQVRALTADSSVWQLRGGGILNVPTHPPALGASWSLAIVVRPAAGTVGTLVAKGSATEGWSLASTSQGLVLRLGSSLAAVNFGTNSVINADGQTHQVVLAVSQQQATLWVDGNAVATNQALPGAAVDCGAATTSCRLYVSGSADGASDLLRGVVFAAWLYSGTAVAQPPVDLPRSDVSLVYPQSALTFDGSAGVAVNAAPVVGQQFSLELDVVQAPGNSGYFVAKSTASGSRFYSLYGTDTRVSLYYRVRGSTAQRVSSFGVSVADGQAHQLLLTIEGTTARLQVDGTFTATNTLVGIVDDCALGSDCVLFLGQRASATGGTLRLQGAITECRLYPDTPLAVAP